MTEPNAVDHWAALAGDLGAAPAPEKPQPQTPISETPPAEAESAAPPAAPPPPIFQPAAKAVKPSRRPAKPSAWNELAGELGIELPPQPVSEPQAAETAEAESPTPTSSLPVEEEQLGWSSVPAREAEEGMRPAEIVAEIEAELTAWEEFDPTATEPRSFEPQEALDVMDETADEFEDELAGEAPAVAGEAPPAEGEERRGRRRRRRRGRGRNREAASSLEGQFAETDQEQPEQAPEEADVADQFGEGLEIDAIEAIEAEPLDEDRDERRGPPDGRARGGDRRRRGRERRQDDAFDEAEEMSDEVSPAFDESEEGEAVRAAAEESGDFESDDDLDEGAESPRIGFRNIPTWQDAVGVMIGKNMEARARSPGGSRGQGGRGRGGRGRGRGGRRPDRR